MNILLATTGLADKAGTYAVLKNISPRLMVNHKVTILTNNTTPDIKCHNLIQLKSIPIFKYYYMSDLKKLISEKFFNSYDIIHTFEYPTFITDYLTLQKNKINPPLIVSAHGTLHQFSDFPYNVLKKIHNLIMLRYAERISFFIASTNAEKAHIEKKGITSEKIKVLPLGVDIPKIERIKQKKKTILYIGRLSVTKNIDDLIKAFSLVNNKNVDLIIAGSDYGVLNKLQKLVKKLKLETRVIFKGRISDYEKQQLLAEATVFVHPSLEDVFSLSLVEAAAAGVPSIAYNVEANSEILQDNVSGKIVQNIGYKNLAHTIDLILDDEELLEKISVNARKLITEKYNWDNTVNILEQYYSEAITKH